MSLINITNLTFCYDGSYENVFENVSFQIDTNWRLGFTGRNGRGKTTFLRLLLGELEYSGAISASVSFEYFPFDVADKQADTGEIIAEIVGDYQEWELERELSLLEVSPDVLARPFCTLSNGEQTKIMLTALFLKENSFLLIDEPTNHLDIRARALLAGYLKSKRGFILVSHDREFFDSCVDHILSINRTNIELQKGNFSSWWDNKQSLDNYEQAENDRLQKEVKKLSAASKRAAAWSDKVEKSKHQPLKSGLSADKGYIGHKSAKMMKRSKAIETRQQAAIDEKSGLLKNIETAENLKITPLVYHSARLVTLEDVAINYDGTTVCEGISFAVNRGERIALSGRNGSGKSSILKLIAGFDIAHSGICKVAGGLVISYVSQDTSNLHGDLRDYAEAGGIDESLFKAILRKLDFSREQFERDIKDFSGGQKKKVLIARSLCERAHLYIWDEPLNFIDVLSRMQIETLIREHCPTMLLVEHDSAFIREIATQSVELPSPMRRA